MHWPPLNATAIGHRQPKRTPPAADTCASTKAGVAPAFVSDALFANLATLAVDVGRRLLWHRRADLLCRESKAASTSGVGLVARPASPAYRGTGVRALVCAVGEVLSALSRSTPAPRSVTKARRALDPASAMQPAHRGSGSRSEARPAREFACLGIGPAAPGGACPGFTKTRYSGWTVATTIRPTAPRDSLVAKQRAPR